MIFQPRLTHFQPIKIIEKTTQKNRRLSADPPGAQICQTRPQPLWRPIGMKKHFGCVIIWYSKRTIVMDDLPHIWQPYFVEGWIGCCKMCIPVIGWKINNEMLTKPPTSPCVFLGRLDMMVKLDQLLFRSTYHVFWLFWVLAWLEVLFSFWTQWHVYFVWWSWDWGRDPTTLIKRRVAILQLRAMLPPKVKM